VLKHSALPEPLREASPICYQMRIPPVNCSKGSNGGYNGCFVVTSNPYNGPRQIKAKS